MLRGVTEGIVDVKMKIFFNLLGIFGKHPKLPKFLLQYKKKLFKYLYEILISGGEG